jgi:ankyrin repeat protein
LTAWQWSGTQTLTTAPTKVAKNLLLKKSISDEINIYVGGEKFRIQATFQVVPARYGLRLFHCAPQLLLGGAGVNAKDVFGRTALFYAADRGDEKLTRLLLDWHADVS